MYVKYLSIGSTLQKKRELQVLQDQLEQQKRLLEEQKRHEMELKMKVSRTLTSESGAIEPFISLFPFLRIPFSANRPEKMARWAIRLEEKAIKWEGN